MLITVLIDNMTQSQSLASSHGLSIFIDTGFTRILFDTGQDSLFLRNADYLGISPREADFLFLSHGHYDHTGGFPALPEAGGVPAVVVHPRAWEARRNVRNPEKPRLIGIPWSRDLVLQRQLTMISSEFPREISPGIFTTGGLGKPERAGVDPLMERFSVGTWIPDYFPDEQALVLKSVEGLVIVTGCTHTGIEELVGTARRITGENRIYALVGGLHTFSASPDECVCIAEFLESCRIARIVVNHCTGEGAFKILADRLTTRVSWGYSGFSLETPPLSSGLTNVSHV